MTLTDFDVDASALVNPHWKHSVLEHNSNLVQQLLLQGCTVKLLPSVSQHEVTIIKTHIHRKPIGPYIAL